MKKAILIIAILWMGVLCKPHADQHYSCTLDQWKRVKAERQDYTCYGQTYKKHCTPVGYGECSKISRGWCPDWSDIRRHKRMEDK